MPSVIKTFYQQTSRDYDQHMKETGHYLAQQKIVKKLQNEIYEPILDLACGPGYLLSLLSKKYGKINANDFSNEMILLAKSRLGKNGKKIHFTNDNAEQLAHYDKKFKTILCCNLFYYIKNTNKALKRWKQLLGKNDRLILIEEYPFKKPDESTMDKHARKLMKLIKPVSTEQIVKKIESNGFKLTLKKKTPIDKDHSLYGLVFISQS